MSRPLTSVRHASKSPAMVGAARFGLLARAFVYLMIGWIALQIALGHATEQANQKGALADIASHTGGVVVLWLLAIGFAAYAIWRLTEAAVGGAAANSTADRLKSLIRGVIYGALSVTTVAFIVGASRQGQSQQQVTLTARVMRHEYGRWLIGLAGVIVLAVGIGMIVEGVTKKFEKQLDFGRAGQRTRAIVVRLGVVGTIARGVVFAIAGALVIDAAVTVDATKSTGLDGALRTLADRQYGPVLLGVLAAGLVAFGVYGMAAARWTRL